jgi:hypothetical protein
MATNNSVDVPLSGHTGTGAFVGSISPSLTTPTLGAGFFTSLQTSINGAILYDNVGFPLLSFFTSGGTPVNSIEFANAITSNSPLIQAIGTDSNISLAINSKGTGGIQLSGQTSGSAFASGYVGEVISSIILTVSSVSIVSATTTNMLQISVTPGNWDLFGNFVISGSTVSEVACAISSVSATFPDESYWSYVNNASGAALSAGPVPTFNVNISTTTIYYLVINAVVTGSGKMSGAIYARRRV